ncbi:YibE/F family protein [Paludicola sp. MB14-C6]|uniref:YibE/F family protein n=1 Tax=Paludihabitans sp. MB14-C6 TaxID=3070656 RepID=UPI0027DCEF5F|nr:YibE/F family protein [Paludicola sp. MB14-C6]WMJ23050.1 YibE/F family protein [Paludicola sp. MB14-C6]
MKSKLKDIIIYCITIAFSIAFIVIGNRFCDTSKYRAKVQKIETHTAKITKITDVTLDEYSIGEGVTNVDKTIHFNAILKSGKNKGQTISAIQTIDGMMATNPKDVEEGDNIILSYLSLNNNESMEWVFEDYHRSNALIWLCIAFFVLVLLFGKIKGVNTIISLAFTCLSIFAVFIPAILTGYNIYTLANIICIFIIIMTLLIVNGANKKSLVAGIGCVGGVAVTGLLTLFMSKIMLLTGAVDQEAMFLLLLNEENPIDLRAIIYAAILIGALGATMDVSMSIASALFELNEKVQDRSFHSLVKSGFAIGRDIMGTMANTLILAYIGSSLAIVLLLTANTGSLLSLFNREMIVVEILQSLVGSLGILFTIPITSILAGYIYHKKVIKKDEIDCQKENPPHCEGDIM